MRKKILNLCILIAGECLLFAALVGFAVANPLLVIETNQVQALSRGFPLAALIMAGAGCAGALVSIVKLMEVIGDSEQLVAMERLAVVGGFAAWAAHQIRNPLAVIRGYAQMLRPDPAGPLGVRDACRKIIEQSDRISDILSQLTALSQPVLLEPSPVDLSELVTDVVASSDQMLRAEGVALTVRGQFGMASGHRGLLAEALRNIITNSIESMQPENKSRAVDITGETGDGWTLITVKDNGCGMTSESLARLFEIGCTTKPYAGGLGLPIARAVVNSHGGHVTVDSRRDGTAPGTRVVVALPGPKGQGPQAIDPGASR